MAQTPLGGRPSKAMLTKVKVGTVAVSIAAFLGTLAGVAALNPVADNSATVTAVVATTTDETSVTAATESSSSTTSQQQAMTLPTVRTRGS